ncbi:hypothetical protein LTR54_003200 [Friedmanniomyces endolithicus]|uniref:Uncharacterized protein n=1 Tax=Friedmanniomyces endolithicus TaxID=329885 RepID=A0AAN6JEG3_9PEZI|nr:hypothetical protein LTR82_001940 [Friedmanniomyces endolithicus]KAK1016522.1 hypothetical protein LTR54_003200 [Friedmanniomyces endolithicus]
MGGTIHPVGSNVIVLIAPEQSIPVCRERSNTVPRMSLTSKLQENATMIDLGASQRPAGVTAHVKPTRFFVSDPHESRRPSYASSMSKYSQATPMPLDCATFQAMSLEGARSLIPEPLYIAVRPGVNRTPALQRVTTTKRSVHGDISHVSSEPRPFIFESPRPAPEPPRRSRGRGPPLAYENHPPRQSRARSLSNSFKEGIQRIGSFARRRSSVAKEDIKLVLNSMRGDECGLGERMSADEKAAFAEELRVRERRQQEAERHAEVKRRVQDDFDRCPRALPPRRGLRRVEGSVGLLAGGPQESALPRKMRTLSGTTDRLSRLGPLIYAGPQNCKSASVQPAGRQGLARPRKMRTLSGTTDRLSRLGPLIDAGTQNVKTSRLQLSGLQTPAQPRKIRTLSGTTDRLSRLGPLIDRGPQNVRSSRRQLVTNAREVSQAHSERHHSVLADQQLYDQVLNDDQVWWQNVGRRSNSKHAEATADKVASYTIMHETVAPLAASSHGRQHTIKRKPVAQKQPHASKVPQEPTFVATM